MLHSTTLRRSTLAVLAATLSVSMMACKQTTTPVANAVTAVTVSPTTAALNLTTNKTVTATATVTVTGTAAKTVAWTTSNSAVATVSSAGLITAVGAGTANVMACSTVSGFTTKCGTVAVTVTGGTTTGPTPAFNVQFKTAAAPAAAGFSADTGAAFNGTSGWVKEANAATPTTANSLDMTSAGRYRNPSDTTNIVQGLAAEKYGIILMHCTTCSSSTQAGPAAWEYKVNNGKYDVTVSVGDADKRNTDSSHVINVEGVNVVAAVSPAAGAFKESLKASISVTDGFLTVDSIGGTNTKINYIKVVPSAVQ